MPFFILYMLVGYWSVGVVLYQNKIVIEHFPGQLAVKKLGLALVLGWLMCPLAVIMKIFRIR